MKMSKKVYLARRKLHSTGHVPCEREHDGHEICDEWFVATTLLFTQNIDLNTHTTR